MTNSPIDSKILNKKNKALLTVFISFNSFFIHVIHIKMKSMIAQGAAKKKQTQMSHFSN